MAPTTIAREAKGGLLDLGKLVSESIAEGKRAMADREGSSGRAPRRSATARPQRRHHDAAARRVAASAAPGRR